MDSTRASGADSSVHRARNPRPQNLAARHHHRRRPDPRSWCRPWRRLRRPEPGERRRILGAAQRLRLKESDRLAAMARGPSPAWGQRWRSAPPTGCASCVACRGCRVGRGLRACNDHRVAMTLAAAAAAVRRHPGCHRCPEHPQVLPRLFPGLYRGQGQGAPMSSTWGEEDTHFHFYGGSRTPAPSA